MCYVTLVTVVDGLHDLSPEEFSFQFGHLAIGLHFQVSMQTASINELHNEENLLVGLEDFIELGNMLMVQFLHNLHFSLHTLPPVWFHQFGLLVNFDGNLLIQLTVEPEADNSVGTLPYPFSYEVVVQVLDRAISSAKLILSRFPIF